MQRPPPVADAGFRGVFGVRRRPRGADATSAADCSCTVSELRHFGGAGLRACRGGQRRPHHRRI